VQDQPTASRMQDSARKLEVLFTQLAEDPNMDAQMVTALDYLATCFEKVAARVISAAEGCGTR